MSLAALAEDGREYASRWFRSTFERRRGRDATSRGSTAPVETADPDGSPLDPMSVRQSLGPSPGRPNRSQTEPVALVVERDDDVLTIRHPDVPGERVESDTWVPVER